MNDKPKTNIQELLKNPTNGKYLKVVARNYLFTLHLKICSQQNFFSDGSIFAIRISFVSQEIWSRIDFLADDDRQFLLQK